jgi:flavodoxin I
MKTLIIYDSVYGFTEKIALAIAGAVTPPDEVKTVRVGDARAPDFAAFDLIIVGAPTQAGRPVKSVADFLQGLPGNALTSKRVAAFDTRFTARDKNAALRLLMKSFGFAAGKIGDALVAKGGKLILPAEGFIVDGREGPLHEGELERAAAWWKTIASAVSQ